jgi:hypothetical protein
MCQLQEPTCGQLVEHHHLEARLHAPLYEEQGALDVLALLQNISDDC